MTVPPQGLITCPQLFMRFCGRTRLRTCLRLLLSNRTTKTSSRLRTRTQLRGDAVVRLTGVTKPMQYFIYTVLVRDVLNDLLLPMRKFSFAFKLRWEAKTVLK